MPQEPAFDIELSPGVNRTQEAAAYARFHYSRGRSDALNEIARENYATAAMDVALVMGVFLFGWFLGKRFR